MHYTHTLTVTETLAGGNTHITCTSTHIANNPHQTPRNSHAIFFPQCRFYALANNCMRRRVYVLHMGTPFSICLQFTWSHCNSNMCELCSLWHSGLYAVAAAVAVCVWGLSALWHDLPNSKAAFPLSVSVTWASHITQSVWFHELGTNRLLRGVCSAAASRWCALYEMTYLSPSHQWLPTGYQ